MTDSWFHRYFTYRKTLDRRGSACGLGVAPRWLEARGDFGCGTAGESSARAPAHSLEGQVGGGASGRRLHCDEASDDDLGEDRREDAHVAAEREDLADQR